MKTSLGVLLVLVCLGFASGCRTSKEGYVAKGNKLFNAGKFADAAINYDKAIQKDAKFGEAYYRLGLADLSQQNPRGAFDALYRAVQLMPNDPRPKQKLGSLSLDYYLIDESRPKRYYDVVKQISDDLLRANPKSFEGLREKGYLAMTDGNRDEAIAEFRKALEASPGEPATTTTLMQNLMAAGQGKEAEQLGLNLIAHEKSFGGVYDVLFEWYSKENRPADAENMLKMKVSNNPKRADFVMDLAAYYARVQRPAEMQSVLQRVVDDRKDFPQGLMSVGDFYLRTRNYPEAVRYYEEGTRDSKGAEKLLYQKRAADALLDEGKNAQAASTVDEIVKENPKDQDAKRVQANLLLRSGDPGKRDTAEQELEELAKEKPGDASISYKLGQAEELKGNLDVAKARYQDAVKKKPDYLPARYALAKIALDQKKPDEVLQQANVILKLRPQDNQARFLHAKALADTGNTASARLELEGIRDYQHNAQVQLELGMLALSDKNFAEAQQILDKLRQTGMPDAYVGLARAYSAQKKFDKALEVLNEGLKKTNNSTVVLDQLGYVQAMAGQYEPASVSFQKLVDLQPKSMQAHMELADVLALKGDDNNAVANYAEATKLAPGDLRAALEYANALDRAGRVNDARAQFAATLKAHPNDAMALNGMAFFIAQNGGDLDQAMSLAQRALSSTPGQPSFSDTVGCIYLKKGLKDSAIQVFGNLVRKYPKYPTFRYHLGMALLEKGDKTTAKKELETALAAHPSRQDQLRIKELLGKIG